MMDTVERARGHWQEILPQFGIASTFLVNRHGPCPLCGGRDRFRFDDKQGSGSYICNQCGAGNGIILLRKHRGWDHATACREVEKIIGNAAPKNLKPVRDNGAGRLAAIKKALGQADHDDVVKRYLERRGLAVTSAVLRGDARCAAHSEDGKFLGTYPAILAPILGSDGAIQSVQKIFDADVQPRKRILPPVKTINGGAVRLFDVTDTLGVAEGVETALAGHEQFGVPTWAVLSANGLDTFEVPAGVKRLIVFGDNDRNFVGQASAYGLAKRAAKKIEVEVLIPADAGADWLNVLNARRGGGQ
jgi:putative DNA primase/helicase